MDRRLPIALADERATVQRSIEILIGKLVTDEEFRSAFHRDPKAALDEAVDSGLDLSPYEIRALLAIDRTLWDRMANELDARLQKVSFKND